LAHSPPDPSDWIRTLEGKTASVPKKVMKRFVIRQNIEHFRALLDANADPSRRRSLEQLLQEEAKLKKYDADNKKESPGSSKPGLIDHALIAPAT
jgi:hypothetical protein